MRTRTASPIRVKAKQPLPLVAAETAVSRAPESVKARKSAKSENRLYPNLCANALLLSFILLKTVAELIKKVAELGRQL